MKGYQHVGLRSVPLFPESLPWPFLRPTSYINQTVSLATRRATHVRRVAALRDLISAAQYSL
jgi:hypothetical protein